jgi:hypothetical protein
VLNEPDWTSIADGISQWIVQHHYSTVAAKEKQQAIAKVIQLAGVRETLAQGTSPRSGVHGPRNRKAARP